MRAADVRYDSWLKPNVRAASKTLSKLLRDFVGISSRRLVCFAADEGQGRRGVRPELDVSWFAGRRNPPVFEVRPAA